MTTGNPLRPWDACVHAGHVVVGISLRRRFSAVSVGDDGLGLVDFEPYRWTAPRHGGDPERLRQGLILDVAGMLAEGLDYDREAFGGEWATEQEQTLVRLLKGQLGEKASPGPAA